MGRGVGGLKTEYVKTFLTTQLGFIFRTMAHVPSVRSVCLPLKGTQAASFVCMCASKVTERKEGSREKGERGEQERSQGFRNNLFYRDWRGAFKQLSGIYSVPG